MQRDSAHWQKLDRLVFLVNNYESIRKSSVLLATRYKRLQREGWKQDTLDFYRLDIWKKLQEVQSWTVRKIAPEIKGLPVWDQHLSKIKGIGPLTGAILIAGVLHACHPTKCAKNCFRKNKLIERFGTIEQFWAYSGFKVPLQKKIAGQHLSYSPKMKDICIRAGGSLIKYSDNKLGKTGLGIGKYRLYFDKERKQLLGADYTEAHAYKLARRKMIKLFLSHLWTRWREIEGYKTKLPYSIRSGIQSNYLKPKDFIDAVK